MKKAATPTTKKTTAGAPNKKGGGKAIHGDAAAALTAEEAHIVERYVAEDEIPHILSQPDMYIGDNMLPSTVDRWMPESADLATTRLVLRPCTMVHGVIKLADEIMVNSRDQVARMALAVQEWRAAAAAAKKSGGGDSSNGHSNSNSSSGSCPFRAVTYISVAVDEGSGAITVENDGSGIEVAMHPLKQKWVPELVFTTLRAGENGAKSKDSTVGGKNSHGAKLALAWSTAARVETVDAVRQLRYIQEFGANLSRIGAPEITKTAKTVAPFTRVTFVPDYARANMPQGVHTPDFLPLLRKRVLDLAAVTGGAHKVRVLFNGEPVPVAGMAEYVARFPLAPPPGELEEGEPEGGQSEGEPEGGEEEASVLAPSTSSQPRPQPQLLPPWVQSYRTRDGRWEVFVGYSPTGKLSQVSFVNGICTYKGGTHVAHIVDQITARAVAVIEKEHKIALRPASIASQLQVFVRADVSRPSFDGQAKEMLKTAADQFGGLCALPPRWIDALVARLRLADQAVLRKTAQDASQLRRAAAGAAGAGGKAGSRAKYELAMRAIQATSQFETAPAAGRYAGSSAAERAKTELMLTEGRSAMTGLMSGLTPEQKRYTSILALTGKPANVLHHSLKTLVGRTAAAEAAGGRGKPDPLVLVARILGLEIGMTFTDAASVVRQLHVARLVFVTDQDHDGSHIKGLLLLYLHANWPSLLRVPGFVRVLNTSVVVARRGREERSFLTQTAYDRWRATAEGRERGWESKYYKGLGTSTQAEWRSYMRDRREFSLEYTGAESDAMVSLAFDPSRADDRKRWLTAAAGSPDWCRELELTRAVIPVEEFVADMMRTFSNYSNLRALPHVVDGFKPSMRKVWFAARKRGLVRELKVSQFQGYVSEHAEYHHGEASLEGTIKGMAQQIAGQNNIALLVPCGQFGTRIHNGGDASASRYIFTKMAPIATVLFPPADDCVLPGIPGSDGGAAIEPPHYVPVLPMALINPAGGMGTGWSSTMPAFHPAQIADYVRTRFLDAEATLGHLYPGRGAADLVPWYQDFRGSIERTAVATRFLMRGVYTAAVATTAGGERRLRVEVTEVPLTCSYDGYRKLLIALQTESMERAAAAAGGDEEGGGGKKRGGGGGEAAARAKKRTPGGFQQWDVQLVEESVGDRECRFVVEVAGPGDVAQLLLPPAAAGGDGAAAPVTPLEKLLSLTSWVDTTNMTLVEDPVDPQTGAYSEHAVVLPRVHTSPVTILERHCAERLDLYARRIQTHLPALRAKQSREENVARFLAAVSGGDLAFQRKSRTQMGDMLASAGYARFFGGRKGRRATKDDEGGGGGAGGEGEAEGGEAEETEGGGGSADEDGYDYLLSMRMHQFSQENVDRHRRLAEAARAEADAYARETPRSLWLAELAEFDVAYAAYLESLAARSSSCCATAAEDEETAAGGRENKKKKRTAAAAAADGGAKKRGKTAA